MIAGEGLIATPGGIDTHVHFICPQLTDEALSSGEREWEGGRGWEGGRAREREQGWKREGEQGREREGNIEVEIEKDGWRDRSRVHCLFEALFMPHSCYTLLSSSRFNSVRGFTLTARVYAMQ